MRAALVVVMLALLSGCRPDEPDDVAVVSEPSAPQQAEVLQPLPVGMRPVQVQDEEKCRQVLSLEAQLQILLTKDNEQHPDAVALREEIGRLRSELPADGTFCSPNSDQQQQRVIAVQRQVQLECRRLVELETQLEQMPTRSTEQYPYPVEMNVRTQIARLRSELPADASCLPNSDQQPQRPPAVQGQVQIKDERRQLIALEADLQQALRKYTEQHPDIVRLRSVIGQLRNRLQADGTCSPNSDQQQQGAPAVVQ